MHDRSEPVVCRNARKAPVAQLDRVSGYEPEGREFESLRARQILCDLLTGKEIDVIVQIGFSRGVAQPGSATALGAVGRGFESLHPDHLINQGR